MSDLATAYGRDLLSGLGVDPARLEALPEEPPAVALARSGVLALTGWPEGPPILCSAPLASCAVGALAALRALAPAPDLMGFDGALLLGEHAALAGLQRRGRTSPGGGCRLLRARDGWLALSLARGDEDLRLLPAWLEVPTQGDPWYFLAGALQERRRDELLERGRLLGLAVAKADPPAAAARPWLEIEQIGAVRPRASKAAAPPLVVDLSSLWAGPLATDLLRRAGARVVKVESPRRPDGARRGCPPFFELLHRGKECRVLDFTRDRRDRAALMELLERADAVVEASRPRALRQLGIDAGAWLAGRPGRVWLSITGYGRQEPAAGVVAFGDDAAVSAGLAFCVPDAEAPLFVGDAVADPLTGIHGALAVWAGLQRGGGLLLDLALAAVAAHTIAAGAVEEEARVEPLPGGSGWGVRLEGAMHPVAATRPARRRG